MKKGPVNIGKIIIALVISVIFMSTNAVGDIAPPHSQGETMQPVNITNVEMVNETVHIDMRIENATVKCNFTLMNPGEDAGLLVGFPVGLGWEGQGEDPYTYPLEDFKAYVNSQPVETREMDVNGSPWMVWDMSFDEMEIKDVDVSYWVPLSYYGNYGRMASHWFTYVLKTGAAWGGVIEEANIAIVLHDIESDQITELTPDGYVFENNIITWNFTSIEPTENIYIRFETLHEERYTIPGFVSDENHAGIPDATVELHYLHGEIIDDVYGKPLVTRTFNGTGGAVGWYNLTNLSDDGADWIDVVVVARVLDAAGNERMGISDPVNFWPFLGWDAGTVNVTIDFSSPTGPQDRSLVQVEGQPEVYWFQNGRLYWVTDWDVINDMSGVPGWDGVNTLLASEFNPAGYPQGPRFITTGAESDGLLIREQGDIKVYLISGGEKHHFTSPEALLWNGYSFDDVIDVEPQIIAMFASGYDIGTNPVHNINKGADYTTIQAAIDDADIGDEIHVDSGTYYENVVVNKQLTLLGIDTGAGMPVVDAGRNGDVITISANGCLLDGFVATNSGLLEDNAGIEVTSNNNVIRNNTVSNNKVGIGLTSSNDNILSDNIVNSNSYPGICLTSSDNNIVSTNTVNLNAYYGIELYLSSNNTVIDNIANSNTRYGIFVWNSNNDNRVISNTANDNDHAGIRFYSSSNNVVSGNSLANTKSGISMYGSNDNAIFDNNVSFNENGIGLDQSSNNIIYHNNIIQNTNQASDNLGPNTWDFSYPSGGNHWSDYAGADIKSGPAQDQPGSDGIGDDPHPIPGGGSVDRYPLMNPWGSTSSTGPVHNINKGTNYTTIQAAIVDASTGDEIHVDAGTYVENVIVDKQLTLIGEGADMVIVQAADSQDHVIEVTADWVNISGFTVTGTQYSWKAGIYLNHSNYSYISDNNASNNDCGILIGHSFNNNLQRNIYFDNWVGISLQSSSYNILKSNNASRSDYFGIHLEHSPSNTIINNLAFSNVYGGISVGESSSENNLAGNTANLNDGDGIYIWRSNNCILMNNNASSNGKIGIILEDANISTLSNNIVENNYGGIYLNDSINNLIYHNNIKYNTNQANDNTAANSWDSGYPSGGNYWSDYIGNDDNKGLNQDQPGSDGIGDTPYPIPGGSSVDRYPLMQPWTAAPLSGKIAFASFRDGNQEVYVMNADGSGDPIDLTNRPDADDGDPTWSPDGTQIAFSSNRGGNWKTYVMNADDGSDQVGLLEDVHNAWGPAWSPDGKKIAVACKINPSDDFEIYTVDIQSKALTQVTDNTYTDSHPSWSPDSHKIVFTSTRDGNQEIYVADLLTGTQTRLTDEPSNDDYPEWSPDGSMIVFVSERDGNPEIYSMNIASKAITRLTYSDSIDKHAQWSPDGQKIIFISDRDGGDMDVYVMKADGTGITCLVDWEGEETHPTWSSDQTPPNEVTLTLVGITEDALPNNAMDVCVSGNYAYVADFTNGLVIVDISDPANPVTVGNHASRVYDRTAAAVGVAVSGGYAYVANWYDDLYVIEVADPTNPTLAATYDTGDGADKVTISGNYAYISSQWDGVDIVDISDPTNPRFVGNYDTDDLAEDVAISGSYAYIADRFDGVVIIDISNPANPVFVGSCDTPDDANSVVVSGSHAYVADANNGLVVIDISNPAAPAIVGHYDTDDAAWGVALSGNYAYVGDGSDGVVVINVSDPTDPLFAGGYDTPGYAGRLEIVDDLVYVADDRLVILRTDASDAPQISVGQGAPDLATKNHFIDAYNRNGGINVLGSPTTEVHRAWGYLVQDFPGVSGIPGGVIMYNDIRGAAYYIHGAIWERYYTFVDKSELGPVASDEREAAILPQGTTGRYTKFETGTIHWISDKDDENIGHSQRGESFVTYGELDAFYTSMGGTYSDLGFPVMDQEERDGHGYCEFEGGYIKWDGITENYEKHLVDVDIISPEKLEPFEEKEIIHLRGQILSIGSFEYEWLIYEVGQPEDSGKRYSGVSDTSLMDTIDTSIEKTGKYNIKFCATDSNGYSCEKELQIQVFHDKETYDTSFRPNVQGYQFGNYVSDPYSWDMFKNTFGKDQVEFENGQKRDNTVIFYKSKYQNLSKKSGGSCFGMSATSLALYSQEYKGSELAAKSSIFNPGEKRDLDNADIFPILDYNLNGQWDGAPRNWKWDSSEPRPWDVNEESVFPLFMNTPKDWVDYYHGLQLTGGCKADMSFYEGVNKVYKELKYRIDSNYWMQDPMVVGVVWLDNGKEVGHAVVPYKITENETSKVGTIFIYDSNSPNLQEDSGSLGPRIEINLDDMTAKYIWIYDGWPIDGGFGAGNEYEHKLTTLVAVSFDSIQSKPELPENVRDITSNGHLGFTDSIGRHLGYHEGEFKDEIPGGNRIVPFGQIEYDQFLEEYYLPEVNLKQELYGVQEGIATASMYTPNGLIVADVGVSPTSVDEFRVPFDGSSVEFISGNGTSSLSLMLDKETAYFAQIVRINVSGIESNGAINLSNIEGTVLIKNSGLPRTCSLYLEQMGISPNSDDSIKDIVIEENSTVLITPLNWNDISNSNVLIEYDLENDGIVDHTETLQLTDTTPPSTVMDLQSTVSSSWINWRWTNPYNTDFSHAIVYVDGEFKTNTSDTSYNLTGLQLEAEHTISILTADVNGNMNLNWFNDTSVTRREINLEDIGFTINRTQIFSGDTVEFNASSIYDPDGIILNYFWHFGDNTTNSTATGILVNHMYVEVGFYNVTFLVMDEDWNEKNVIIKQILVNKTNAIPPSSISNLHPTAGTTYLNWTWTNPSDSDFNHTEIYLDGAFQTITSAEHYNATNLTPETEYTISTRTVDTAGNINQTWMNDTATTLPAPGTTIQLTISLNSGWNLISAPLNLTIRALGEEAAVGDPLNVTPENSLTSIYRYNTTSGLFEKCTHYPGWGWESATGSESFTELEPGRGYWVMAENDCDLTFTGTAPSDLSLPLDADWNCIGWYSTSKAELGAESVVSDPLNVTPENSLSSIYRYNTTSELFEKCTHYPGWGWAPATGSESFTELEPGRGYWVMAENDCVWNHET